MRQDSSYRFPLILSIVLHVFVFAALLWHFTSNEHTPILGKQSEVNIIRAVAMNTQPTNQPKPKPAPAPPKTKPVETPPPKAEPIKPKVEPVKLPTPKPESKPEPKPEPKQLEAPKLEQPKLEAPKPVVAKKKIEQQTKVDFAKALEAQQAAELAAEKKKVEKTKAEQKKAEAAKLAKQKELEKQKQLVQEQLVHAEQNALAQELAQEQQALSAASSESKEQIQSEIDKYKAMVVQAIAQNWIVPTGVDRDLSCELLIQVAPGGAVLSVQVARSSGDPGLDNSAKTAVSKASPLPVPKDADLFDHFRQLRLTVKPKDLVDG